MIIYYWQKAGTKLFLKWEISIVVRLSDLTGQVMHAPKYINA